MPVQRTTLNGPVRTVHALVRALPCVDHDMMLQSALLHKLLATDLADILLDSRVSSSRGEQASGVGREKGGIESRHIMGDILRGQLQ